VTFSAAGTTGSNTLNVSGLGAKALMQYDLNGALVAAVITSGLIAVCQYNGTYWVVLDALPSSTISSTQQTLVSNEGAAGAQVPIYKSGVLSTNKGVISVSLAAASTYYDLTPASNQVQNTMTIPTGFWIVGKTIKLEVCIGYGTSTVGNVIFELLVGGVSAGVITFTAPPNGINGKITATITCTAVGVAGVSILNCTLEGNLHGMGYVCIYGLSSPSTLVGNAIDLMAQSSSVGSTIVYVRTVTVSVIG
jgi:hypothetical protein